MIPGVAEQIRDNLLQPQPVAAHPYRMVRQIGDETVIRPSDRRVVHRVGDQLADVDVRGMQFLALTKP